MVAFRGSSSAVFAGAASTTIAAPTGLVAGDLMLMFVSTNANTTSSSTGWTALDAQNASTVGNNPRIASFYKTAAAGDVGASYTVTISVGGPGVVEIVAYSAAALDVHIADFDPSNGTTTTDTTTVTTTAANDFIVHAFSARSNSGSTPTLTLDAALSSRANGTDSRQGLAVGDVAQATAGADTPRTCTSTQSSTGWVWNIIALKPAASGVTLSGSVSAEKTLAGTLTVRTSVAASGSVTSEQRLAGTLGVNTPSHLTGSVQQEHSLTAALTVAQPLSTWQSDDIERTDLPLELWGLLSIDPVEAAAPAGTPYITVLQASVTMPTPTLVNGRPDSTWVPSVATSTWAQRLQLVVGGVDVSFLRGMQFVPLLDASVEPFGDAEASFAFPGLTEFDNPASFGLTPLAQVTLRRKDANGVYHRIYEGDLASLEPDQLNGQGLVIQCVGAILRLDLLKQPPTLLAQAQDLGDLIPAAVNDKRRRYSVNVGYMKHVSTGIQGVGDAGAFKPFLTGFVQDYLSIMGLDNGSQWTVGQQRPRTPVLKQKDMSTVNATVSYGAPGVDVKLSKDFTTATTAAYGTGSDGHCSWMGARFPNLTQGSAPSFPLAPGNVFNPGDGQSGFAPFAAFLRRGQYGQIESDDTYLASDTDSVKQFQDRANITVDGIVGAQTWEAAFQPGANQGSMSGAYIGTIYEKAQTRQRKYNAQGADVGPNPAFDPTVPRIEDYVPFGENVSKKVGTASAKQIISRNYPAGREGTITLTSDPQECSRFDLDAGMNVKVTNYAGSSVLVHITRRERDWQTGTVTLTVDEKARDEITRATIRQRDKDIADLTRRRTHGRTRSRVFNDYGAWLCEDGAGEIPLMNQQGGFWNVQRIAAARKGTIERISLALGAGLTEHVLNQNLSVNPPASIPGAARGCIAIFSEPISANALDGLPGLATPLTAMADGTNPWNHNTDELTNYYGLVYAAGGPGNAIGFYPNNDPGDGTSTNLTGRFEDGGSVQFGPNNHYWLWVAIWCPTSCLVGGRIFPGAPA